MKGYLMKQSDYELEHSILSNISMPIIRVNHDGKIRYKNIAAYELLKQWKCENTSATF